MRAISLPFEVQDVIRHGIRALTQSRCRSHGLSCRTEKTSSEQIELCAALHLALDELEVGDLPFGLSVGPGFYECNGNRLFISFEPIC